MPLTTTLAGGSALIKWLLRDEFTDTRAAGAVNGTPATPGPGGPRVVVDTTNVLTVGSGFLNMGAGPVAFDPGLWHEGFLRLAGRVIIGSFPSSTWGVGKYFTFGFDSNQVTSVDEAGWYLNNGVFAVRFNTTGPNSIFVPAAATNLELAMVLRVSGGYAFAKIAGAFWTLQYIGDSGVASPVYPGTSNFNVVAVASDYMRCPDALYLPTPLAYDSFTRANGALGSSEATGPDGQTAPVKVWQSGGATWTIAGNEVVNTPTEGADLLTNGSFAAWTADNPDGWGVTGEVGNDPEVSEAAAGESHVDTPTLGGGHANLYNSATASAPAVSQTVLTIDNWYAVQTDIDTFTAGNLFVKDSASGITATYTTIGVKVTTGRAKAALFLAICVAANSDVTIDSISIKQLTLNTLFSNVETGTADVVCQVELDTIVDYTQAGLVLNLDDKDTPANFVIAHHNGVNRCRLEKCVAGTYTTVINVGTAYAAGATLVVIKEGTAYSLYYNNAKVGATSTVSDAGIIDNTLHGMFSTDSGNQLDNFLVMPRGTNGEYSALNRWSA